MRTLNHIGLVTLSVCLVAAAVPVAAASDQTPPAAPDQAQAASQASQGPLVLRPSSGGYVLAPDVKVTQIDHVTEALVGGYGGILLDNTFLLGAGGYWAATGSHDRGMWYIGPVVGWSIPLGKSVRFGVRGLVGGGQARLSGQYTIMVPGPRDFDHVGGPGWMGPGGPWTGTTVVRNVRYDQGFFVAEPQADLVVRLSSWVRFNGGVSYRAIAGAHGSENQLNGVAGSVSVQFGRGF